MKREIETIRNVVITAIAAALLAVDVWTLAAADVEHAHRRASPVDNWLK